MFRWYGRVHGIDIIGEHGLHLKAHTVEIVGETRNCTDSGERL